MEEKEVDYNILVAKKSEKLVTALYLVTDLTDDSEPIKHALRKNAVALLSSMNSLAQLDIKDKMMELKMSLKRVTETLSLLHVASSAGIVSKMNGEILIKGFRSLQLVLEKRQPFLTEDMVKVPQEEHLTEEMVQRPSQLTSYDALTPLSIARLHESQEELRKNEDMLKRERLLHKVEKRLESHERGDPVDKRHISKEKDKLFIKDKKEELPQEKKPSTHSVLMQHASVTPGQQVLASSFQMKKLSRRDQIVSLFVKGIDVSIKDIAAKIKGCSEKTIQRELNALVYDNVIERIGEKRWSRYVLK